MSVGRICQRDVDTARITETARVAAQRMAARNVGSLVVTGGDGKPVGIVTDRDLALRCVAAGLEPDVATIDGLMSGEPVTIRETESIERALGRMRENEIRRLVVVNDDADLVGVVSLDDVLAMLAIDLKRASGLLEVSSPRRVARGESA